MDAEQPDAIKVLLVEDVDTDAELVQRTVNNAGLAVIWHLVKTREAFIEALETFQLDIVLSDYGLVSFNGRDVVDIIRLRDPYLPVIIVTGMLSDEVAVQLIQAGASDYIRKDRLARLPFAINHTLENMKERRDRWRVEEALCQSEAKYRRIVDTANEGIWQVGPDGLTTFVNARMAEMLGYAPEEMLNKPVTAFMFEEDVPDHAKKIENRYQGKPEVYERHCRRKDGKDVWGLASAIPIFDNEHRFQGSFAMVTNITERHQAEEDLRRHKDQLEETVRSRTAELELVRDAAEVANKAKSTFLTATSHDLRQPLQASLAYLSALSRKVDRKDLEDLCDKIRQPLKAMGDILEALLDISELESGHLQPHLQDFALNELLLRVVACAQQQAQYKGLSLSSLPTELTVHSDPKMLERIVSNFVTNAVRYTDKGLIGVYCEAAGDKVCISVTDTGIGIPADALNTIFEDHVQLGNPARDRHKGLGLGLSIAKRIADALGHRISVQSELCLGSSFSIELPQAHNAAAHVEAEQPAPEPMQERPIVLLIDDDQDVAEAVQMLLQSYSFETYVAHSRDAVLAMLKSGLNPGLVLCDYRLPDVNGIDLIRQVREVLNTEVPAVLITGDMGLTDIPADLAKCTLLHKPVDAEIFLSVIGKLVV